VKRRALTLVVLAGAVVLVAAAGSLVAWHPWDKGTAPADQPAQKTVVSISELDQGLIRSIELISAKATIELDSIQGTWRIVKPAPLGVKAGPMADLLYSITNLRSDRVIEEHPRSLTPYGLDSPAVTVRVTLTSGESRELYLGNMTPAGDTYYLMARGDPRVFAVAALHGTYFNYEVSDLWEGARAPLDASDIVALKILRGGKRVVEVARTEELYKSDVEFRGTTLSVVYPYVSSPKPVDSFFLTDFVTSLGTLRGEVAIDANPKDRTRYGLAVPSGELVVKDGRGTTLDVQLGGVQGQVLYLQFVNDPAVYAGDPQLLNLLDVNPFAFVSKYAAIVRLDDVDTLTFAAGSSRHVLEVRRVTPGSETGAQWLVDGHGVTEKAFKDFYQLAISLQIDSLHTDAPGGTPALTMTFGLNKGASRTFGVTFVPYSQELYAVNKNGTSEILVNHQQVKVLLQRLDQLAAAAVKGGA
jgi:hypothetical protein